MQKIQLALKKKFSNQDIEFELEQSDVPPGKQAMLAGVKRYQLILNQQPTQLYLDQDEVDGIEHQHGEEKGEKIAVQAASQRIRELLKEQTNESTNLM